jgi:neutral ceramidase
MARFGRSAPIVVKTAASMPQDASYLVGAGIYDITGPAAGIVMMGYAVPAQKTSGIHMRLRSRAFIVGDGNKRVVFVSAELGMLFQMVKLKVSERLAADEELSKHYDERNVLLSATHTHGGPGGYSGYFLYDVTVKGFVRQNFDTIVDGIYQSIRRAHQNLQPGRILINEGSLEGAGGNRAVEPYENNPADERSRYESNTDTTFTLLKLVAANGEEIGTINWFGVHPDSIGPDNTLITGDNKGLAAYLFEKDKGTDYLAPKTFVAAFAQASAGDVTPNVGFGQAPGEVTFEKNKSLENATLRQYEKAKELYDAAALPVTGSIDCRHEWVDMRTLYVESAGTTTAAAAMGASFSAGSPLDNPSPAFLFPNGTTVDTVSWREHKGAAIKHSMISALFAVAWPKTIGSAYRKSHAEKPILLPTGIAHLNLSGPTMTPQIMPVQVLKIGSLAIIAVPAEVTTMAGRRFKSAVLAELASLGVKHAVISSLANSYSSYLATREEYAKQWYEGAGTQFGPHQQAGFQQEYAKLCRAIVEGEEVPPGPTPPDVTKQTVNFTTKVWFDEVPYGKRFGDLIKAPQPTYARGDTVVAQFWGGHPNNDCRIQGTFLTVEKLEGDTFRPALRDWDPETTFRWERRGISCSVITISWDTKNAAPGTYRIVHTGDRKSLTGAILPYEGITEPFTVEREAARSVERATSSTRPPLPAPMSAGSRG